MKFAAARGNVQIAYDVLGAGAPVVMLHDFGESSGFWYEFGYVKTCLAQGRQVVLVDLRGHGDSSEPVDAMAYGPIHCSWDVIAVLDHAGIRARRYPRLRRRRADCPLHRGLRAGSGASRGGRRRPSLRRARSTIRATALGQGPRALGEAGPGQGRRGGC